MLKTVSSITNAIGALNYKGTWNASTNSPALASGVGTKGDYYVVSVAGSTNLDGETLWGVGDWAVYNGAVWQKVEGGNTINATTVSASTSVTTPVIQATSSAGGTLKNNSGTAQMQWGSGGGSNLSLEVATNINPANAAVNISPTGTGTVTISPAGALTVNPTAASTINNASIGITTPLAGKFTTVTTTDNVIQGTAAKGFNFTANTPAAGMTSQLLNWYEEGTFTPTDASGAGLTFTQKNGRYTRIGRTVTCHMFIQFPATASTASCLIGGLPFNTASTTNQGGAWGYSNGSGAQSYLLNTSATTFYPNNVAGSQLTNVNMSASFNYITVIYII